jgi:tRNA wybutosine-synthesizing protein 2
VNIPAGYHRYGDAMVLRFHKPLSPELGQTVLDTHSWCTRVFQHKTTSGVNRKPELIHLAGDPDTEVLHLENGVKFIIDLSNITFSGGNRGLRERLVKQVQDGEHLLDMFAAVGNLSLQPIFYHNITAILVERDPYTFKYLVKSLQANQMDPLIAYNLDCRKISLQNWADRIFMGFHDVDYSHFSRAIEAAKENVFLHLHPLTPSDQYDRWIDQYQTWLKSSSAQLISAEINRIKSYAPGIEHIEVILEVEKLTAS